MPANINENNIDELILKLQDNLKDVWRPEFSDKHYVSKWLKAREYDIVKAEIMLRTYINWRIKENIDTILEDFQIPEVHVKYGVGSFCGHDKEGRPIWIETLGRLDPQGFLKALSIKDIHRIRIYEVETFYKKLLPQRTKEEGRPITQNITILDMEHFSVKHLWKPAMECVMEATTLMEANYPESMAKLIIIKAPPVFKIAYNFVKPFLNSVTQNKICFYGSNYKEELLKIIDSDQLPAIYGGTMYGPDLDPYCRHLLKWGGIVPSSYYFNQHVSAIKSVKVKPSSKLKLPFLVDQPGSFMYYEVSTESHDIQFAIYHIGEILHTDVQNLKLSNFEIILQKRKVHSKVIIEKGELPITKRGYYVVEFDNSYSWTTSKLVHYHIEVLDIFKNDNTIRK